MTTCLFAEPVGISPGFHEDAPTATTMAAPVHYDNPGMMGIGGGAHIDGGGDQPGMMGIGGGAHVDGGGDQPGMIGIGGGGHMDGGDAQPGMIGIGGGAHEEHSGGVGIQGAAW